MSFKIYAYVVLPAISQISQTLIITLHSWNEENYVSSSMWVLRGSIYGALKTLSDLNNQWKAFGKYLYFLREVIKSI